MKRIILVGLLVSLALCGGCAQLGNSFVKTGTGIAGGDYRVTLYSGGKAVRAWEVKNGIITEEEGSDGWYFSCGSKLVRLSGDVVVEPLQEGHKSDIDPYVCN